MTFNIISTLALLTPVLAIPLGFNVSSFPSIATYTALGDSYASGNGAGTPTGWLCGRFSDAYPIQLTKTIGPVRFHSAACGGASTTSVIWDQLAWIGDSDLVTLTVGGNEVDFVGVLNECVYQWCSHTTCEDELRKSRRLIQSSTLFDRYVKMVKLVLQRMKPKSRLLVTGYATFFNEETTACDAVTFSVTNSERFLTRQLRREMNHLVRMLNRAIQSAVEVSGAEYVDIDTMFKGHRFCEYGVREPDNSRLDTWFFNLRHNCAGARMPKAIRHHHSQELFAAGFGRVFIDVIRVFHPTKEGHAGIRDAIVKRLQDRPGQGNFEGEI